MGFRWLSLKFYELVLLFLLFRRPSCALSMLSLEDISNPLHFYLAGGMIFVKPHLQNPKLPENSLIAACPLLMTVSSSLGSPFYTVCLTKKREANTFLHRWALHFYCIRGVLILNPLHEPRSASCTRQGPYVRSCNITRHQQNEACSKLWLAAQSI